MQISNSYIETKIYYLNLKRKLFLYETSKFDKFSNQIQNNYKMSYTTKYSSLVEASRQRWKIACEQHSSEIAPIPKEKIKWASVAKCMQTLDSKEELSNFIRRDLMKELPDPAQSINSDICDDCGVQMMVIANDSMLACSRCGKTRVIATVHAWSASMDADFSSLNVNQKSRLLEWLEYAQAKEYGDIPLNCLEEISSIVVRHKLSGLEQYIGIIKDEYNLHGPFIDSTNAIQRLQPKIPNIEALLKNIDSIFVRNILKNCNVIESKKHIERSAKIASLLSGFYPERLTADQEEYIRKLFMAASPVYDRYRKASQPNWPGGYAYFLRCLLILLGWDEIAALFPIQLTGRNAEREEIRSEIWSILQWENVPSVGPMSPVLLEDQTVLDGSIISEADKKCKISSRGYDELFQ